MVRECPVCGDGMEHRFTTRVLGRHTAAFDLCRGCEFLQARDPFWLAEAYSSPISLLDTGLVARNLAVASRLANVLQFGLPEQGEGLYLDYAGGYGLLTRLMRDRGFDFYWADKYAENLFARGFEYQSAMEPCRAVTAIELLEHSVNPIEIVSEAMRMGHSNVLLASTELFIAPPPEPSAWWYYAFETGQHISFFTENTLRALARRSGLKVAALSGFHIFYRGNLVVPLPWTTRWRRALTARLRGPHLRSRTMGDHLRLAAQLREGKASD
jgi:hypothetical protein